MSDQAQEEPRLERLTFREAARAKERVSRGIWVKGIFDEADVFGGLEFQLLPKTDPRVKSAFDEAVRDKCAAEEKALAKRAANGTGAHAKPRTYADLSPKSQRAVMRWELAAAIRNVRGTVLGWPDPDAPDDPERDTDLVFDGSLERASENRANWGNVMRAAGFPERCLQSLSYEISLQSASTAERDEEIARAGEGSAFGSLSALASMLTETALKRKALLGQ